MDGCGGKWWRGGEEGGIVSFIANARIDRDSVPPPVALLCLVDTLPRSLVGQRGRVGRATELGAILF